MIDRRRAARATGPSTNVPCESGPRCTSVRLIPASRSGSAGAAAATIPQIPHTRGNSTSRYGDRLTLPPVDHALARRLEDAGAAFSVARLEAIRDRPETGLDLRIERFGAAIAPASPAVPELDFVNRIERL